MLEDRVLHVTYLYRFVYFRNVKQSEESVLFRMNFLNFGKSFPKVGEGLGVSRKVRIHHSKQD